MVVMFLGNTWDLPYLPSGKMMHVDFGEGAKMIDQIQ
jgi:hypothetical protein